MGYIGTRIAATIDKLLVRRPDLAGEFPLATLTRGFVDQNDNLVAMADSKLGLAKPDGTPLIPQIGSLAATFAILSQAAAASRDYVGENYQAFASRVSGKTPSTNTLSLFSAADFTGGTSFVRNPSAWCSDIDLTCFSPWNSTENNLQGGCLITPRHVVLTDHFSSPAHGTPPMVPGVTSIKFVGVDNTIYTRTLSAFARCGTSDVLVGTLDSDLPAAIRPAKLLPAGLGSFVANDLPLLTTDQQKRAFIKQADATILVSTPTFWTASQAADALFTAWTTGAPATGDSGSVNGFVIGGEFYLAFLTHGTDVSGNLVGDWVAKQLAAVNSILGSNYALSVPDFTDTHDSQAYHAGDSAYFDSLTTATIHFTPGETIIANDADDPQPLVALVSDANGAALLLSPGAGKSIRIKNDNTRWEPFTPGDFDDLGSLPSMVVNGRIIRVGSHAYMGLGGIWKQLDN